MPRIIHALPCRRSRKTWIVRTDGVADVTILGEEQTLAYAKRVAQALADRLVQPVTMRVWNRLSRYTDETFTPAGHPQGDHERRRRTG